jgi:hypothetical protein
MSMKLSSLSRADRSPSPEGDGEELGEPRQPGRHIVAEADAQDAAVVRP